MRVIFRTLGLLLLFCVGARAVMAQGTVPAAASPDATAIAFYTWYIHELSVNRDPRTEDAGQTSGYVSAALLREIERRLASPKGMDDDYFLQAQDYLNDWVGHVRVSDIKVQAESAALVVTLGRKPDMIYRLGVGMVREAGVWKVRSVKRLRSPAASLPKPTK